MFGKTCLHCTEAKIGKDVFIEGVYPRKGMWQLGYVRRSRFIGKESSAWTALSLSLEASTICPLSIYVGVQRVSKSRSSAHSQRSGGNQILYMYMVIRRRSGNRFTLAHWHSLVGYRAGTGIKSRVLCGLGYCIFVPGYSSGSRLREFSQKFQDFAGK